MIENYSINKNALVDNTHEILDKKIDRKHVSAIVSILIEEIIKDMISNKEIKIHNFIRMFTHIRKPQKYHDCILGEIKTSAEVKHIKMSFLPKLRRIFLDSLDVDSTSRNG